MLRSLPRALLLSIAGAIAGVIALILAFRGHPGLVFEIDRDLPGVVSGLYPVERIGRETFAWTREQVTVSLPGLDRRIPWSCALTFRGGRPPQFAQPLVVVGADGVRLVSRAATNTYEVLEVSVPTQASPGLTLTISSSPTFVPGPSDTRALGIQVDRLACQPAAGSPMPPRAALLASAVAGAAFGAGFGLVGLPLWSGTIGVLLLAAGLAIPLSTGPAPYTPYVHQIPWLAAWIVLACAAGAGAAARWQRRPLSVPAAVALAVSAASLFIELAALLHPAKLVIDALFHAHRLEWVLSGRYFFTQPMPSGVRFPYAIGLYVMAAPWTALTHDYIALLKIVVSASRALAGLALYPLVTRAWGDRGAAALAVLLFHLAPLPFLTIGNANLTYAFGQSMMALTLAAAATWGLGAGRHWQVAGLFVLASIAFLSHVGIFPIALAMLVGMAALYWIAGGSALKGPAARVLAAAMLAAVFSIASYYGHFTESYKTLARTRAEAAAARTAPQPQPPAAGPPRPVPEMSIGARIARAGVLGEESFGWPILALAAIGAWRVGKRGVRDRLGLLLVAALLAYVGFVGFSVVAPVDPRFQRYNEEFISRINYATLPMVAILAAAGAAWTWRAGLVSRASGIILLIAALSDGLNAWRAWLR